MGVQSAQDTMAAWHFRTSEKNKNSSMFTKRELKSIMEINPVESYTIMKKNGDNSLSSVKKSHLQNDTQNEIFLFKNGTYYPYIQMYLCTYMQKIRSERHTPS